MKWYEEYKQCVVLTTATLKLTPYMKILFLLGNFPPSLCST